MRILAETSGYATPEMAIVKFEKACIANGLTADSIRYLVSINNRGRYNVTVLSGGDPDIIMAVLHGMKKVCII